MRHTYVSTKADPEDPTVIGATKWNASHTSEGGEIVPIGGIIGWSGTVASIPAGYALCDGVANAPGPDWSDLFVTA